MLVIFSLLENFLAAIESTIHKDRDAIEGDALASLASQGPNFLGKVKFINFVSVAVLCSLCASKYTGPSYGKYGVPIL